MTLSLKATGFLLLMLGVKTIFTSPEQEVSLNLCKKSEVWGLTFVENIMSNLISALFRNLSNLKDCSREKTSLSNFLPFLTERLLHCLSFQTIYA